MTRPVPAQLSYRSDGPVLRSFSSREEVVEGLEAEEKVKRNRESMDEYT